MPIVLITEALLQKSAVRDARILRDRMLSGFCVRMNARTRTFRVATSVAGQQFRLTLGHWPLISVDEARAQAMQVLRECRAGRLPAREIKKKLADPGGGVGCLLLSQGHQGVEQQAIRLTYANAFWAVAGASS